MPWNPSKTVKPLTKLFAIGDQTEPSHLADTFPALVKAPPTYNASFSDAREFTMPTVPTTPPPKAAQCGSGVCVGEGVCEGVCEGDGDGDRDGDGDGDLVGVCDGDGVCEGALALASALRPTPRPMTAPTMAIVSSATVATTEGRRVQGVLLTSTLPSTSSLSTKRP